VEDDGTPIFRIIRMGPDNVINSFFIFNIKRKRRDSSRCFCFKGRCQGRSFYCEEGGLEPFFKEKDVWVFAPYRKLKVILKKLRQNCRKYI